MESMDHLTYCCTTKGARQTILFKEGVRKGATTGCAVSEGEFIVRDASRPHGPETSPIHNKLPWPSHGKLILHYTTTRPCITARTICKYEKHASGGKVSHLESGLRMLRALVPRARHIRWRVRPR